MEENIKLKPYSFRKLKAYDIPFMLKILKKIGIKRFKECFTDTEIQKLITDNKTNQDLDILAGGSVFINLTSVIIDSAEEVQNELNEMLANVSGLSTQEINNFDFDVYMQMIMDFFKKEEFMGFLKAVLKLFKKVN